MIDENGNINSNYGYYVFYEPIELYLNQYNWVISVLKKNKDSRRAIININQSYHKSETKDFP
ncbi:Thymidylate synthase (fragment) [Xenorhabdus nematophila str. Websteri]